MKYQFYQVDVFTNSPFGGNPLAVFIKAEGLSSNIMQKIAREMNLSETTFVLPAENLSADYSIRIFTPAKEIPFAGHPILGTAHIMRKIGKIAGGDYVLKLATQAGIITVTEDKKENLLLMEQHLPKFQLALDRAEEISGILGIPTTAIDSTNYPIQIVSTGLPVLIVPIVSLGTLNQIIINENSLKQTLATLDIDIIYAFTRQTVTSKASVHSRAFAPSLGIAEDPATGSAAGAIGAYLCKNNLNPEDESRCIYIEQGYKIGRPASLYVEVVKEEDDIKSIRVGGESVTVIEGWINI